MMRSMDVAMTARDLPDARMRNFVWGHTSWPGFNLDYPLDDLPRTGHCVGIGRRVASVMQFVGAAPGDDGLHHLVDAAGEMTCEHDRPIKGTVWPEGFRGREYNRFGRRWVKWTPTLLTAELVDPMLIPRQHRCPVAHAYWPGDVVDDGKLGGVRRRLVDEFGPGCMICPDPWAVLVDHDHLTGMVRGYLCRDCNVRVDNCRHLDECLFAIYLNDPPAQRLQLEHPNHAAKMKKGRYPERAASTTSSWPAAPRSASSTTAPNRNPETKFPARSRDAGSLLVVRAVRIPDGIAANLERHVGPI
jgi:hypothetical protein